MPIQQYFKGKGQSVMESMKKRYGEKKGKSVFYATARSKGLDTGPSHKVRSKHGMK